MGWGTSPSPPKKPELTNKNIWGLQKMSGVQKQKGVCTLWESEHPLWRTQYFLQFQISRTLSPGIFWNPIFFYYIRYQHQILYLIYESSSTLLNQL